MMHAKIIVLLLGALVVAATGCTGKPQFVPVEGTVTKEGKPLADVIVEFHPDFATPAPRSHSVPTDASGHYQLRSYYGDDGAVVGQYRVCIHDASILKRGRTSPPRLPTETAPLKQAPKDPTRPRFKETASASRRVPRAYGSPNNTPLQVEVQPGTQVIDLEVK
jgi:hypothetical protein